MNSNDSIASKIVADAQVVASIYDIIKRSALSATKQSPASVCILQPNKPGINRVTQQCSKTEKYTISYDANDITIIGGAALNLYDVALKELKERRGLAALEDYIKKKTTDIDMTWWPRSAPTDVIVTSKSEAILLLVDKFKKQLAANFENEKDALLESFKPYIPGIKNTSTLQISIDSKPVHAAGVHTIIVNFLVESVYLKLCDIAVHDGGASQQFTMDGEEITHIKPMQEDPVYCNPSSGQKNSIQYLNINGTNIAVPNIELFVKQQLFAFNNLLRKKEVKAFINYKRVEFIKQLLNSFKLNNSKNLENLKEVFQTDNIEYPNLVISKIEEHVKLILERDVTHIMELCSTIESKNDKIISELCSNINRTYQLNRFNALYSEVMLLRQSTPTLPPISIMNTTIQKSRSEIILMLNELVPITNELHFTIESIKKISTNELSKRMQNLDAKFNTITEKVNNIKEKVDSKKKIFSNYIQQKETQIKKQQNSLKQQQFQPPLPPTQPPLPPSSYPYYKPQPQPPLPPPSYPQYQQPPLPPSYPHQHASPQYFYSYQPPRYGGKTHKRKLKQSKTMKRRRN